MRSGIDPRPRLILNRRMRLLLVPVTLDDSRGSVPLVFLNWPIIPVLRWVSPRRGVTWGCGRRGKKLLKIITFQRLNPFKSFWERFQSVRLQASCSLTVVL